MVQKYKHYIQFIPQGSDPHETSSVRLVDFCNDITNKSDIKKSAYYEADKQNIIDKYALRKHWTIFNMEIEYHNPPWNGWTELRKDLISFKEVESIKNVDERIYLFVKDNNSEKKLCNKIENYYHGFTPISHSQQIIRIKSKPTYN